MEHDDGAWGANDGTRTREAFSVQGFFFFLHSKTF